jgi:hypothetical protein
MGLLERLLGPHRPQRDYHRGPKLAGLDAVSERAIELQKRYWSLDADELRELEGRGFAALSWAQKLRLHHLRCLALLDAGDGALRRELLAPVDERPTPRELAEDRATWDPMLDARVGASARALVGRRSPYRPRHGFAWLGEAAPAGEDIPYSNFQGRTLNASITHLGCVEVIRLDEALEPAALEFVGLDEILTISRGQRSADEAALPFVPARILREYGREELVVLLALRYGLSWFSHEPELLRGRGAHEVGARELGGLADPAKAVGNPRDRRPLGVRAGVQTLECLSDYEDDGLGRFALGDAYQLSLAIDQGDPRFVDKCRGRGLDPEATRGDVVRELRLRASARATRERD